MKNKIDFKLVFYFSHIKIYYFFKFTIFRCYLKKYLPLFLFKIWPQFAYLAGLSKIGWTAHPQLLALIKFEFALIKFEVFGLVIFVSKSFIGLCEVRIGGILTTE